MKSSVGDLVYKSKDNTVNRVGGKSKIDRIGFWVNSQVKLAKFKWFIKLSSEVDFLTPGARLAFGKLKQVFIKALIFYDFDLKYHI